MAGGHGHDVTATFRLAVTTRMAAVAIGRDGTIAPARCVVSAQDHIAAHATAPAGCAPTVGHSACSAPGMPLDAASSSNSAPRDATFADVDVALVMLGHELRLQGYTFSAVTAATQARYRARLGVEARASSLADIFGWNLPFSRSAFPSIAEHLDAAGLAIAVACADDDGNDLDLVRSAVSFCTNDGEIIAHGTSGVVDAAVRFTPDTARTIRLLRDRTQTSAPSNALIVRAGCGAVGLRVASNAHVVLVDDDAEARRLSRINAALAGVDLEVVDGVVHDVDGLFDLVVIEAGVDSDETFALVDDVLPKLAAGGRLLLATRTAIVDGVDVFREAAAAHFAGRPFTWDEVEADLDAGDDDVSDRVAFCVLELTAPRLQAVADDDVVALDVDGDFI